MAEIAPFRGVRYDQGAVGDLSKVVSPPYDIISPEDRVYYHRLHPNNFVRLILGEELPEDDDTRNRFTRAKAYLDQWLSAGILKHDPEPAIYIYEQQFDRGGPRKIRGIKCAVKIHEYSEGVILPHENTLAKPKSQLAQLIRETAANLDCVYGLYADAEGALDEVFDTAMNREPDAEAVDKDGVLHRVWVVTEPAEIEKVTAHLRDKPVAIADGHHRYETALGYRNEMSKQHPCEELPSDYLLMTLVNVYEKDMTIFPTHRVVDQVPDDLLERLDGSLSGLFEVEASSRQTLLAEMESRGAIGVYRPGSAETLRPRPEALELLEGCEASRKLELNVLHRLILERTLGIDEEKLRNQTNIFYTRDAEEAMCMVDTGQRQAAFLLNNIEVKSVLDIASAGDRMPQKATYFYPKLLSGMVLRRHEASEAEGTD